MNRNREESGAINIVGKMHQHDDNGTRRRLTPAQRLAQDMQQFGSMGVRVALMAIALTIPLVIGILMVDMPARYLDSPFGLLPGLRPADWISSGHVVLAIVPLISLLFARRFGGSEVSYAIIAAWTVLAFFLLFELSILAAVIEEGDFPGVRFIVALVAGHMSGQLVSVGFYDIVRGGGRWWRAPFYSACVGYFVTSIIYFPVAYWHTNLPWGGWLVGNLLVMLVFSALLLPVYGLLRRRLRPRGGFGGA